MSLIEVAIGIGILGIILGSTAMVGRSTSALLTETSTSSDLHSKTVRALETMAFEMHWAENGALLITEDAGWDRVDFHVADDYVGDEPVWSSTITYRVEPWGFDGNQDTVLDEGRLVREQDGEVRVLSTYVVAGGFEAVRVGDNVELHLRLAKMDSNTNRVVEVDANTSISPRN